MSASAERTDISPVTVEENMKIAGENVEELNRLRGTLEAMDASEFSSGVGKESLIAGITLTVDDFNGKNPRWVAAVLSALEEYIYYLRTSHKSPQSHAFNLPLVKELLMDNLNEETSEERLGEIQRFYSEVSSRLLSDQNPRILDPDPRSTRAWSSLDKAVNIMIIVSTLVMAGSAITVLVKNRKRAPKKSAALSGPKSPTALSRPKSPTALSRPKSPSKTLKARRARRSLVKKPRTKT